MNFYEPYSAACSIENWRAGFTGIVMAVYLCNTLAINRIESGFAAIVVTDVWATKPMLGRNGCVCYIKSVLSTQLHLR
jgi:hypothetical protein